MGSMSIWHWVIVLVVILLVFGTKKLSGMGSDLGKAIKGFKEGIKGENESGTPPASPPPPAVTGPAATPPSASAAGNTSEQNKARS